MSINVALSEREELHHQALLREKGNTSARTFSLYMETILHTNPKTKVFNTLLRLSGFT
jgi:hypothetical protein